MSEKIIGIDLGTTNSEVAVVIDGQVKVIPDEKGRTIIPSVIGLNENNELIIGQEAKNQFALYPEKTILSIKRHMGNDELISIGDQQFSPPEFSAMILKHLKKIAENYLGHPVQKAIITVPAFFSDAQRQATRLAGELAGLEVVRIINEPTAASMAYEGGESTKKVLVYDFGGGTFDVSVVAMSENIVEVIASHGNNQLGGDDFDKEIINFFINHIQETYQYDVQQDTKILSRLKQVAEKTKMHLSDHSYCLIQEEYLFNQNGNPVHLSLELSRDEYEEIISPYIDETFDCIHTALEDANLKPTDIDEIYLVGGTTRTPLIQVRLEETFKQQPRTNIHPDLCVAMGAAIQAGILNGEKTSKILVDVTPFTFGTEAIGLLDDEFTTHLFCPIIRKNSPIPITKSQSFRKMHAEQKAIEVGVFQGEDADARNNIKIGEFLFENLSQKTGSEEIIAQFHLDINGILQVTALEKKTGETRSITINNVLSNTSQEKFNQSQERIDALFNDTIIAQDSHQEAQSILLQANKLLEKLSADDQKDVNQLISEIQNHIENNDIVSIEKSIEELKELIYFLEMSFS